MILSEDGVAFEVFLQDVPDGADTLLIEGEALRVRGSLNGNEPVPLDLSLAV